MSGLRFEDVHEYPGRGYYPVPNEHLETWQELLQGLTLYKAAGICSGGEVGFFNLLPLVRRELVLVDHSYKSLYFAMVKYLLLEKYGAEEAYRRLTSVEGFKQHAAEFDDVLPPAVLKAWGKPDRYGRVPAREATGSDAFHSRADTVAEFWGRQSQEKLVKTCSKLSKVTFIHGDLTDLAARGKFGLVYLSNALEHLSRTQARPVLTQVERIVKPGGYVLTSQYVDAYRTDRGRGTWEIVNEVVRGNSIQRTNGELRWKYTLYRVPEAVAA